MRPVFERLMAGLVRHGCAREERKAGSSRRRISLKRQIPPGKFCASYIEKHPGHLPEALLCEGNCAELGVDFARRKGCGAGLVLRDRRGVARSILRRRSLHQPLARSHRRGGEHAPRDVCRKDADCAFSKSARGPADWPRRFCRSWSAVCIPTSFSDVSAAFLLRRRAKAGRVSGSGVQDFRSRKTGRRAGTRSGDRSTSSSAPTCCTRSAMCAPRCAICTTCSRRAAASFSWTPRRRNSGRRRSSA